MIPAEIEFREFITEMYEWDLHKNCGKEPIVCCVCKCKVVRTSNSQKYCIDCFKSKRKEYYKQRNKKNYKYFEEFEKRPERIKYIREYQNNYKEIRNEHLKEMRRNNPVYKLKCNLRTHICRLIRDSGNVKNKHTFELLGYNGIQLKSHLEHQFRDGMTWDNWGDVWHIDHIIPISLFNWESKNINKVIKKCYSLSNLRPLKVKDNLKKHNKLFT